MDVHRAINAIDLKEEVHFGDLCIKVGVLTLKLLELRRLAQC
jgi:hypothetical protein